MSISLRKILTRYLVAFIKRLIYYRYLFKKDFCFFKKLQIFPTSCSKVHQETTASVLSKIIELFFIKTCFIRKIVIHYFNIAFVMNIFNINFTNTTNITNLINRSC